MDIIKVFVNENYEYGNPVGIIVDEGKQLSNEERQQKAINSGFSEIVFINNVADNDISIFSPTREIPFAGHAVIGTAYFLNKLKRIQISSITSMGSNISVDYQDNVIWVKAEIKKMPNWNFKQLRSVDEVERLTINNTLELEHCVVWSWINEAKGVIRARTFAPDWLIPEDEANGSGALLLSRKLDREIKLIHGKGSIIYSRPVSLIFGEVGGVCQTLVQ